MRPDNPLPSLALERLTLANGLEVFLIEDHAAPLVAVNVNYHVGSKDERPGRTGFAHLFEHMMFQGSKHWNQDYFKALAAVGGEVNGATNTDRTRYWELLPAAYLERALWLEADRMGFLLEALTQERLDAQRSVVKNERRQSYENRPYGMVRERLLALLYPPDHPYHWPTIGSMADIDAASLDDVRGFFRTFYAPSNAGLCIAGDFEPEAARALVERYFAELPPGPPAARVARWVPELPGEVALAMEDRVQLPRAILAWHTVPVYAANDAELDVFGRILGRGKTSRLYRRLVYQQGIAQDAVAAHASGEISGTFTVMLTPRPGHTLAAVEDAARTVLEEALANGVTAEELERAQTTVTAEAVRGLEQLGRAGGRSDKVNEYFHYLRQPDRYRWDLQRTLDLTPEAVTAAARAHLGTARVVVRVTPYPPLAAVTGGAGAGLDRSVVPGRGAERALRLPARQRFTLANGARVVLVEHRAVPLVSLVLLAGGGSATDPPEQAGLASLTAALLPEGAGGRPASVIAEALESLGAELHAEATGDTTLVGLSALRSRLAESAALLADVVARPDFDAEEVERQRTRRLVLLTQLEDSPEHLAQVALTRALLGGHPYGHDARGTRAGIAAIAREHVAAFWDRSYRPADATLLVVGDTGRDELEATLERAFAGWRGGSGGLSEPPPAAPAGARTVYLVDRPEAAQSVIACGLPGAARTTPDHAALQALNAVLGGQFVSRLNLNLREQKGYTYGVRSRLDFARSAGMLSVVSAVHTAVTAAALGEIVAELSAIADERPVTAAELADAQGWITNGYARRFETQELLLRTLLDPVLYGLPDDTVERYPEEIRALTTGDVTRAARAYLAVDRLAIVVVGDAAAVRADLERLDLGPLVTIDREGNPLPT